MRIQNVDNTSFKAFRVNNEGKKALSKFLEATSSEARPEAEKLLLELKTRMDGYASTLDSNPNTRGLDILLTTSSSDGTNWENVPALCITRSMKRVSETLELNNLSSHPYDPKTHPYQLNLDTIQKRSGFIFESTTKWFNDILERFTKDAGKKAELTPSEIVKNIFG